MQRCVTQMDTVGTLRYLTAGRLAGRDEKTNGAERRKCLIATKRVDSESVSTMRHVFKAKKLGWGDDKTEGIWFDADDYTKEEAEAEFKPYQGVAQRGYDYTGYEYDGERYHHYTYLGEFEDDDMPTSDADLWSRK